MSRRPEDERTPPVPTPTESRRNVIANFIQGLLTLAKVGSVERQDAYDQLIKFCLEDISNLEDVLLTLVQDIVWDRVYTPEFVKKILHSQRVVQAVMNSKDYPSPLLFQMLNVLSFLIETKKPNVFRAYFQLPNKLYKAGLTTSETTGIIVSKSDSLLEARQLALNFVDSLISTLDIKDLNEEHARMLASFWQMHAEDDLPEGNLFSFLLLMSRDTRYPEQAESASAMIRLMSTKEEIFLGLKVEDLKKRRALFNAKIDKTYKVRREQLSNIDPIGIQIDSIAKSLGQFIDDDESATWTTTYYPRKARRWNESFSKELAYTAKKLNDELECKVFGIQLPDGGYIVLAFKPEYLEQINVADFTRNTLLKYFAERPAEPFYEMDGPFLSILVEMSIHDFDPEKALAGLDENRKAAQGGMSTISTRGDNVVFRITKSEGDKYLYDLGIRGITIAQMENGIACQLRWFNAETVLQFDQYYRLVALEGIEESAQLWLENMVLIFIGAIKNALSEAEASQKPVMMEEGGWKVFQGRRPHLKVLPFGQQSRKVDLNNPGKVNIEEMNFMLHHFGVSLFTLNWMFRTVQQDSRNLETENFEFFLTEYEQTLPDWMKMRTDIHSVKAIIEVAVKRTQKRDMQVQYTPQGIKIGNSATADELSQATQYFSLTLVSEAKPHEEIVVEPMNIWVPEATQRVQDMSESSDGGKSLSGEH